MVVPPTPVGELETSATAVGGEFNRWYNITMASGVDGAEDSTFGDYICMVCIDRDTPFEECHNATMQLYVLGDPPDLDNAVNDGEWVNLLRVYRQSGAVDPLPKKQG